MIIGLDIEKVDIPHEPGEWMLLREGLSPYQMDRCIESRLQESREASAPIIAAVGMDAFQDIVLGLVEGRSARDLAKQANAPKALTQGDTELLPPEDVTPEVDPLAIPRISGATTSSPRTSNASTPRREDGHPPVEEPPSGPPRADPGLICHDPRLLAVRPGSRGLLPVRGLVVQAARQ